MMATRSELLAFLDDLGLETSTTDHRPVFTVAESEDVGERFADQARAMHHGEVERRNIRGRTTPGEALELLEEGVDVLPLPPLPVLKETLQ